MTGVRLTSFCIAAIAITAVALPGQILLEDFSTAFGTTPPAGWSQITDETGLLWSFDDPGSRGSDAAQAPPFAIFDSDFTSMPGNDETVALVSKPFDVSAAAQVILEFDHEHIPLAGSSTIAVDVWDGVTWNAVFSTSAAVGNGTIGGPRMSVRQSMDVTTAAGGAADARVRFTWNGTWDWWWSVDNVFVGDPVGGGGQAPRPGIAEFDVNESKTASGFGIALSLEGPYFSEVSVGTTASFRFSGEPGQPIVLLAGTLAVDMIPLGPPLGQVDLDNIIVVISGFDPGLPGALMLIGTSGEAVFAATIPAIFGGQSLAFQPYVANTASAAPGGFANCVEVTFVP